MALLAAPVMIQLFGVMSSFIKLSQYERCCPGCRVPLYSGWRPVLSYFKYTLQRSLQSLQRRSLQPLRSCNGRGDCCVMYFIFNPFNAGCARGTYPTTHLSVGLLLRERSSNISKVSNRNAPNECVKERHFPIDSECWSNSSISRKRCGIGRKLLLLLLLLRIGSCIQASNWYGSWWHWMTLNGV